MKIFRNTAIIVLILLISGALHAQFSTNKLEFRIGYNLHNTSAGKINHLIEDFNNDRYPLLISKNLPSINWLTGMVVGANYVFRDDMLLYANFKSRRQFIEAPFVQVPKYRQYLFRSHTLEIGLTIPIRDDDFFNHYVGGGLLLGLMEGYTAFLDESGYAGSRKMVGMDNSGIFGLSLAYEAQLRLHRNLRIFIRPVAQFAIGSPMRKLSNFFDPQIQPDGSVIYGEGEPEKYDRANLNGLGIEGGLLVLLPEF